MSAHSSTTTLTPKAASASPSSTGVATASPARKAEPTIFTWDLAPYDSPSAPLSAMIWRCRIWFEATFVFTMLEPWEKAFLMTLFTIITSLFVIGVYKYLPYHLQFLYQRGMYYLLGRQEQLDWTPLHRAVGTLKTTIGMDKIGL
ncbi:uncharacterized protein STEHIDRAFT_148699 [Stereum hirsutum FP-91666 SS1]|uniref:uncharacterized protein n=1 Tax=Stereum hirsutum (strain FP-91666) TaxID=721885 RepID=UPI000444A35D|nr:uncharacterized protein STEHIDRAFT_148699 [Stereum hirsutum FP-91666 SS1]EIM83966.1 hypothetical protein STEHIDRAFT_148699 [Stereum hirsutum FP-91666 SS1]